MKKIILTAAIAVIGFTTTVAQESSFGIKGGVNFASLSGDDADDLDGRTSFHVGFVGNFGITETFAIQPEVIYSGQGASFDVGESEDANLRLGYINVPVLADFTVGEGFSLQAGPQVGFNVSSDVEFDGETEDLEDTETIDFSLAFGAQYALEQGVFFQARYGLGLSEVSEDVDIKNNVIAVSVGYKF